MKDRLGIFWNDQFIDLANVNPMERWLFRNLIARIGSGHGACLGEMNYCC